MPTNDQLYFESCSDLDTFFREGREHFNERYLKKLMTNSPYYNRVERRMWPMNTGTSQRGFRFGRGFYDPCNPFKRIVSERCEQNSCDSNPEVIQRPGTDSYTWELLRRQMKSEWICVEDLTMRLFPAEEIMHIEDNNARVTKNVHEEFVRSNYIFGSSHKWVAFVNDEGTYCGRLEDAGFFVPEHSSNNDAGPNMCNLRVKCSVADLANIAQLSLDVLDEALIDLQDEDDAFRLDLMDAAGQPLLDIIIPDVRVGRSLYFQTKNNQGYWDADTDFDKRITSYKLGVNRVIGDYAFGYDITAPRFNADTDFNAALPAFDEADPATWPRLLRVPKYICEPAEIGGKYVPNRAYKDSDFGISVAWVPQAMVKWERPALTGYGSAQMEAPNYAGDWEWRRPDWECNEWGKSGYFRAEFHMGAQFFDPTIMHSFLHRLDRSKNLRGSCCPLQEYRAPEPADCYVCEGVGEGGEG